MPHIQIITWPLKSDEVAVQLIENITQSIHSVIGCSLDKISVSIHEIHPTRWGEAGIVGSSPDFFQKN